MRIVDDPLRRYLIDIHPADCSVVRAGVLVIGSGVAGLRAAMEASRFAPVTIVTKGLRHESNTFYAQGGIAAAMNEGDTIDAHARDTLESGKGLCDPEIVRLVAAGGGDAVRELIDWGARFDRNPQGDLAFTAEGGHSAKRILHTDGDLTGREIERALLDVVSKQSRISLCENAFVLDLLTGPDGAAIGAVAQTVSGTPILFTARAVIVATGGGGHLFRETTNPKIATGDGYAMMYRAGCALRDMEFIQFHPTTLYIAGAERTLITEAARGEGALLRDVNGHRFMPDVHPRAELAPRDSVSAGIVRQMKKTDANCVMLDMTHMDRALVKRRFPHILALCESFNLNPFEDMIPVRPSVHYVIGGAETDAWGRTNVAGLYACGEAASSGLHGANRLGSNSLLEGMVMGRRAGQAAGELAEQRPEPSLPAFTPTAATAGEMAIDVRDMINSVKSLMWKYVGLERDGVSLRKAETTLRQWASYALPAHFHEIRGWTLQNMLTVSLVMCRAAMEREETRGCHQRLDFPETDDAHWRRHLRYQWQRKG